jgi:branched-chain amino acid transport system permease protein
MGVRTETAAAPAARAAGSSLSRWIAPALLVFGLIVLVLLPLQLVQSQGRSANSTLSLLIFVLIAVGLGSAWNILGGYAGQLSMGHIAFYGIGAYSAGVLSVRFGISGWWGLVLGPIIAAVLAASTGWITMRLRGPYFVLATIAIAQIIYLLSRTFDFVGGAVGLDVTNSVFWPREPQWLFGPPPYRVPFYWIALALAVLAVGVSFYISRSKIGYYLRAVREDEDTAQTAGINTTRYKIFALVISAVLVAMLGAFRANFSRHIDPDTVLRQAYSLEIVLFAIIGGLSTVAGPIVGAVVLTIASDWFRQSFGQANELLYGILLVLVIFFMPNGLLGGLKQVWQSRLRRAASNGAKT